MDAIVTKLRRLKIEVNLVDGKLRLNAPKGVLTKDILEEVNAEKAHLIEYINGASQKSRFSPIKRAPVNDHYPLSSAQTRLYFLYEFDRTSTAYNSPQFVKLEGRLDKDRLADAFRKLVQRHDNLRTSFVMRDVYPVQRVADHAELEVQFFQANDAAVNGIMKQFVAPFDLASAPLIRVGAIETSAGSHILMVDMHHIITDGVTRGILVKEFMALYNRELLPEPELQYKDFVAWQQEEEQRQKIVRQREFWLNEFASGINSIDLPLDFSRPAVKSYQGASLAFKISPGDTTRLRAIALQEGASMYMVILSLYAILLAKLSNSEDVIIGTTTAGRQRTELENIMGMFVNTLALRNHPKGTLTFRQFLSNVRTGTLACFDHQDYPFDDLIDDLKIPRSITRNPLFDVMFAFQNFEISALEIPGLRLSVFSSNHTVSLFDLTLSGMERDNQVFLNFEYATTLFKAHTIELFVEYFKRIVSVVISDSARRISEIGLLSEEESNALVVSPEPVSLLAENVIALFAEQVRRFPDRVALHYGDRTMSYWELNRRAEETASCLSELQGVKQGDLVCLLLKRSDHLVSCIIGVLKIGAAYIPMDPGYPVDRINAIIEDSGAKVLVTQKEGCNKIRYSAVKVVDLDEAVWAVSADELQRSDVTISHNDLAYVIYTSGSTGKPKGVMIEHGALANYCSWAADRYVGGERATFPLFTSIAFDLTVTSIFVPLITGNDIVIYEEDENRLTIEKVIRDNRVNVIKLTPSHLKVIREIGNLRVVPQGRPKVFIVGGEDLETPLATDIHRQFSESGITIYNEYGPTEATVGCMIYKFDPADTSVSVPIGVPIDNTAVFLLDQYLKPVPYGVKGELYVSGKGLARGYLAKEELTALRFLAHPFIEGARIYRTGDLALRLPDGKILYCGRTDDQLKIRGFRVEPAEIANLMTQHPLVKEAVVIARKRDDDLVLTGYYVAEDVLKGTEMRTFLLGTTPEYMVPAYFIRLEAMPLTMNGKLNKAALPDAGVEADAGYEPPSNAIEETLVAIWAEVLKIDRQKVSVNRSFFELGGNSMKIIHLNALINKKLNLEVSVAEMFRWTTIGSFVKFIQNDEAGSVRYVEESRKEVSEMQRAIDMLVGR